MHQHQHVLPLDKKQTYVMVQYSPLNSGSGAQYDSYRGLHQFVPPPAIVARCPKLTRYKMIGLLAVVVLSLFLLTFMAAKPPTMGVPFFRGDDQTLAGRGGLAASPMCSLTLPEDANLSGGVELTADAAPGAPVAQSPETLDNTGAITFYGFLFVCMCVNLYGYFKE